MDFIDEIRLFGSRVQNMLPSLKTEEATKHSLVLPFLQILGYNVFDPGEVVPEFGADVGAKKGEKVDYAIIFDGKPSILIEAKSCTDKLSGHDTQLFRYFSATNAKFAILTNGLAYKFYSDLQEPNKMDLDPFLEFNLMDLKEQSVSEVKKFHKSNFNTTDLVSEASNLRYTTKIRVIMDAELREPSEEFLRFWLKDAYSGKLTANVLDRFRPLIKKAISQYINDLINDRLKSAIQTTSEVGNEVAVALAPNVEIMVPNPKSVTTTCEEMEAFYAIKAILREHVDPDRLGMKDTASYCNVLLDNNVRKWVCRFFFSNKKKSFTYVGSEKIEVLVEVERVDDIFKHKDELIQSLNRLS